MFFRLSPPSRSRTSGSLRRSSKAPSTGCVRTVFGVFLLIGVFVLFVDTIRPVTQSLMARRWVETPCVVDSSRAVKHVGHGRRSSSTYSIEVVYHYGFGGQTYSSARYQFATAITAARASKQRVVDHYPPGSHTICYVNPGAPSEAVIYRGLNSEVAYGAIGIVFPPDWRRRPLLRPVDLRRARELATRRRAQDRPRDRRTHRAQAPVHAVRQIRLHDLFRP